MYPTEQVATVPDGNARQILTVRGLPEANPTSFRPVPVLCLWDTDRIPMCVDTTTGEVLCVGPDKAMLYPVNTTLRAFVDSLDAIANAAPLSPANGDYDQD